MKILFLHGWTSTPGGKKPTFLKDTGHEVLNPALPDEDFEEAVRIAQAEYDHISLMWSLALPVVVRSPSTSTAKKVGARHGRPVVLVILAQKMHQTGHEFFVSSNGVWLTESVPSEFIDFPWQVNR